MITPGKEIPSENESSPIIRAGSNSKKWLAIAALHGIDFPENFVRE
jgi:hypothetical protein